MLGNILGALHVSKMRWNLINRLRSVFIDNHCDLINFAARQNESGDPEEEADR